MQFLPIPNCSSHFSSIPIKKGENKFYPLMFNFNNTTDIKSHCVLEIIFHLVIPARH